MKRLLPLLVFLLCAPVFAQTGTTTVTATVTDSDAQTWNSGNYTITLLPGNPNVVPYSTVTKNPIQTSYSGSLSGGGALSVVLTDTQFIAPAGSTWTFKICPNVGPGASCGTTNIAVTGGSQTVTTQLNAAITAPRIGGGPGSFAYADVEVQAVANNSYYNNVSAAQRCYTTSWAACGGGGTATLPTATAAGQTIAATGAGTTYVAGGSLTAPLTIPTVSSSAPLYVEFAQRDDAQSLYLQYSVDATNYYSGGSQPITPLSSGYPLRDPSVTYDGTTYWIYVTGYTGNFYKFSTTNLSTWTAETAVPVTGSPALVWAPRPFLDPVGAQYYMNVGTGASGSATTWQQATFNPTTQVFGTFNTLTIASESTCTSGMFDFREYYNTTNTTYYVFYACQQGGSVQYIHYASSASPNTGFTRLNTGVNDPFGFGGSSENPDLILMPSGNIRIFADTWVSLLTGQRTYLRKWVDTQSNFATVVGTPVRIGGPNQEAGSNLTVTGQAQANTIFTAVNKLPTGPNQIMSPLVLDGPASQPCDAYSLCMWQASLAPGQNPNAFASGTPSFGLQNPDGNWSTLVPTPVLGVGFKIIGGANSGNVQTGIDVDGTQQVAGKLWRYGTQSGASIFSDQTDLTTPMMMVGVPGSYLNLAVFSSLTTVGWNSNSQYVNSSLVEDTGLSRCAAGCIAFGNGTQANSSAQAVAAAFTHGGTTFAVTGCGTATSLVGGSTGGKFVGGSATCTPVVTMGGGFTANNGFACSVSDMTTSTAVFRQTAYTTTTATFTAGGVVGATDSIVFSCQPF